MGWRLPITDGAALPRLHGLWRRARCRRRLLRAGCLAIGPRIGRWDPQKHGEFVLSDVKTMLGGVLLLWVGWYGFNPGSTHGMTSITDPSKLHNAVLTTTVAGSAGGVAAVLVSRSRALRVAWRKGCVRDTRRWMLCISQTVSFQASSPSLRDATSYHQRTPSSSASSRVAAIPSVRTLLDPSFTSTMSWTQWRCISPVERVIAVGLFHHKLGLVATGQYSTS